jgi:hypothetical protein
MSYWLDHDCPDTSLYQCCSCGEYKSFDDTKYHGDDFGKEKPFCKACSKKADERSAQSEWKPDSKFMNLSFDPNTMRRRDWENGDYNVLHFKCIKCLQYYTPEQCHRTKCDYLGSNSICLGCHQKYPNEPVPSISQSFEPFYCIICPKRFDGQSPYGHAYDGIGFVCSKQCCESDQGRRAGCFPFKIQSSRPVADENKKRKLDSEDEQVIVQIEQPRQQGLPLKRRKCLPKKNVDVIMIE